MVGQYKEQMHNFQQFVSKFMMSVPVALAVVIVAMVQFQEQIQLYFYQYLPMFAVIFAVWTVLENYQT